MGGLWCWDWGIRGLGIGGLRFKVMFKRVGCER